LLVGKDEDFSVSFGWVGLKDFGELANLFRPFSGFWREEGTKRLDGLTFLDGDCFHIAMFVS